MQVHQCVFHVLSDFGNQVDIVDKQFLEQSLEYIAFICEDFSKKFFMEPAVFQWFSVIDICLRNKEFDNFTLIIDHQVQFKPKEPPDCRLPFGSQLFEYFMRFFTLVDMAHSDGCGINEQYTCVLA